MKKLACWVSLFSLMAASSAFAVEDQVTTIQSTTTTEAQTETPASHTTSPENATDSSTLDSIGDKVNDAAISATLSARYAVDPLLGPFAVNVSTTDGMVTLKGQVNSKTQYERAMYIATSTKGVSGVSAKELTVSPTEHYLSDAFITTKVKSALLKAQYFESSHFSAWDIHVETHNGTVFLVGHVRDANAKNRAMEIAGEIHGVKGVEADLETL